MSVTGRVGVGLAVGTGVAAPGDGGPLSLPQPPTTTASAITNVMPPRHVVRDRRIEATGAVSILFTSVPIG